MSKEKAKNKTKQSNPVKSCQLAGETVSWLISLLPLLAVSCDWNISSDELTPWFFIPRVVFEVKSGRGE